MVIIPNLRLKFLYNALIIGLLVLLTIRFIWTHQWALDVEIGKDIWAFMAATNAENYTHMMAVFEEQSNHETCRESDRFDFWRGTAENMKFVNYTCRPPCPVGVLTPYCVPSWEMAKHFSSTGLGNSLLLVTQARTDVYEYEGDQLWQSNYLVPSVMGIGMAINYGFNVVMPDLFGHYPGNRKKATVIRASSRKTTDEKEKKIATAVVGSNGEVAYIIPWGSDIHFTLPEMLEMAGAPDLLDRFMTQAGTNQHPEAYHPKPHARLSGGELIMDLKCYDQVKHDAGEWEGDYLCYLSFKIGPRVWLSLNTALFTNFYRYETHLYGLHVAIVTSGTFEYVNLNRMMLEFTSILVLLGLPKQLVLFLMIYCLGHLSKIYKRVIYEDFPLRQTVAGVITRMIASTSMFTMLSDVEGEDDDPYAGGISKASVKRRLQTILRHRHVQISPQDMEKCVDFCFFMLYKGQNDNEDVQGEDEVITLDGFTHANCSIEKMNMDHVIALFDFDRSKTFFEQIFTPSDLRKDGLEAALRTHDLHRAELLSKETQAKIEEEQRNKPADPTAAELEVEQQLESELRAQNVNLENLRVQHSQAKEEMLQKIRHLESEVSKAMQVLHKMQKDAGIAKIDELYKSTDKKADNRTTRPGSKQTVSSSNGSDASALAPGAPSAASTEALYAARTNGNGSSTSAASKALAPGAPSAASPEAPSTARIDGNGSSAARTNATVSNPGSSIAAASPMPSTAPALPSMATSAVVSTGATNVVGAGTSAGTAGPPVLTTRADDLARSQGITASAAADHVAKVTEWQHAKEPAPAKEHSEPDEIELL